MIEFQVGFLFSNCPLFAESLPLTTTTTTTHWLIITKTCLYNIDPFKPHLYIVKLGFTGVYIILLISAKNIYCEYSLEPPRRGGSNEYPQSMFWTEIWKNIGVFCLKFFSFWRCNFLYIWIGVFSKWVWFLFSNCPLFAESLPLTTTTTTTTTHWLMYKIWLVAKLKIVGIYLLFHTTNILFFFLMNTNSETFR